MVNWRIYTLEGSGHSIFRYIFFGNKGTNPSVGQYISGPRFELGVSWIRSISGSHPIAKFGWNLVSVWRKNTMILDPQWWPTQACVCDGAEYKLGLTSTADVSANKHYGHRDEDRKRVLAEYGQNKADLNQMSQSYKYSRSTILCQDYSHKVLVILHHYMVRKSGIAVEQWLRCCATNRKVAGSIPDGLIGIFHWHNPSDRTIALGSTQPLTEMSTRRISWG